MHAVSNMINGSYAGLSSWACSWGQSASTNASVTPQNVLTGILNKVSSVAYEFFHDGTDYCHYLKDPSPLPPCTPCLDQAKQMCHNVFQIFFSNDAINITDVNCTYRILPKVDLQKNFDTTLLFGDALKAGLQLEEYSCALPEEKDYEFVFPLLVTGGLVLAVSALGLALLYKNRHILKGYKPLPAEA